MQRDWLAFDRDHVWHPYAPMHNAPPMVPVASAQGVRLTLEDGRTLIDGMASWWCAVHGYNHPALNEAVRRQLDAMAHVMFGGLTHRPAVALCARLLDLAPDPMEHVFLCDSGSISVEVALKMAIQYQHASGRPERQKIATIRGGYHGDTAGAMAVCDPVGGMHKLFAHVLPVHHFAPMPRAATPQQIRDDDPTGPAYEGADIDAMARLIEAHSDQLAAVIVEPIVQGAGGMRFYAPGYLRALRALCDAHGLLLIFDEIATGFGRSGTFFAADRARVDPDILCVGKALTGGYMTLAACLATAQVARVISDAAPGALMHGPTFMGNPLACAVALASLDLLADDAWSSQVAQVERALQRGLEPARALPAVADVRVLGAIGVVELHVPVDVPTACAAFVERGVWVRPFRKCLYVMPPYVTTADDLATLCAAICEVAALDEIRAT